MSIIKLVPFSEEYISECYIAWLNDPEVVRFSELRHKHHTVEDCRSFIAHQIAENNEVFAILAEKHGHIGNLAIYYNFPNKFAELSILIGNKTVWGKGYGLAAWRSAMERLQTSSDVRKIIAGTMKVNHPMLKIFEKSGMRIESVIPNYYLYNSTPTDFVLAAKYTS